MKFVVLAFALAAFAAPAWAEKTPPLAVDAASASAVVEKMAGAWNVELSHKGETRFVGILTVSAGNRFQLDEIDADKNAVEETHGGVWGILETAPDGAFVIGVMSINRDDDGSYRKDDLLVFSLKDDGTGVLTGEMSRGPDKSPMKLTRR